MPAGTPRAISGRRRSRETTEQLQGNLHRAVHQNGAPPGERHLRHRRPGGKLGGGLRQHSPGARPPAATRSEVFWPCSRHLQAAVQRAIPPSAASRSQVSCVHHAPAAAPAGPAARPANAQRGIDLEARTDCARHWIAGQAEHQAAATGGGEQQRFARAHLMECSTAPTARSTSGRIVAAHRHRAGGHHHQLDAGQFSQRAPGQRRGPSEQGDAFDQLGTPASENSCSR